MTKKTEGKLSLSDPHPYPPDIAELIAKFNGVIWQAENYAGIPRGQLSKIKMGSDKYTDFYKNKVKAALEGKPIPKTPYPPRGAVPAGAPPLLKQLIEKVGTKAAAMRVLGTSDSTLAAVLDGSKTMPAAWLTRAKAAMGLPVITPSIYSQKDEPMTTEKPPITTDEPPFVLWDGKSKGTLQIAARGGKKGRSVKGVPQPIIDLVLKHNGVAPAAKACGVSANPLQSVIDDPKKFNEKWQRKVHAGMHGLLQREEPMGDRFDKYLTGFAIVLLKAAGFDHVAAIAEILNANLVFKKNTSAGWILIYRMKPDDLPRFKKIAMRDANEIVCP